MGKPSKSKHNILPSGSLQFLSLSKEDHGEWECVATNVVTSITASTRILVIGTKQSARRSQLKLFQQKLTFQSRFESFLSVLLFCTI